jgi:macrolide phosphotransferase
MIHNAAGLLSAARQNGLCLDLETLELDESGLDFLVAFATDQDGVPWVLRAPRRPDVVELAAGEHRVLELVHRHLPVAVPEWRVNTPELIAYPRLPGTPAATIDPAAKDYVWHIDRQSLPAVFIDSLAASMAALHRIDLVAAAGAGMRVLQPMEVRQSLAGKMDQVKRRWGVPEPLWRRWQSWLADDTYWPPHPALVHGDLHAGHILVDADVRVTGLLDWTEAEVGDPAADFTLLYAIFGEAALDTLLERYNDAGGRTWPRMRDHVVELLATYPVTIAMFALRTGNEAHIEMARMALNAHE